MNKHTQHKIIPTLRFPEFEDDGEWEECQIGQKINFFSGYAFKSSEITEDSNGIPLLRGINITEGFIRHKKEIDRYFLGDLKKLERYLLRKDDLVIGMDGSKVGKNSALIEEKDAGSLLIQRVARLRAKQNESIQFIFQQIHSIKFHSYVDKINTSSGIPHISADQIKEFILCFPKIEEQQKIANCLSSLDELIEAQSQKLLALKTHKKGLMQQLFPAEGETVPKLRFPEFLDDGDWEECEIGQKIDFFSGYAFKSSEISEDSNGIPLLRGINITEGFVRHTKEIDRYFLGDSKKLERYLLKKDDLVIGMDGSKVGKNSALIEEKDAGSLLIQRVARLRAKSNESIQFIFQQIHSIKFHSYVDRINTSSGIPHISADQIKEFILCFPKIEEQQKIADCLSSLDEQIQAQSQKIAALKLHKKGLMQQLFPSINELTHE
jgi:type I restriction enzyme, S subunit